MKREKLEEIPTRHSNVVIKVTDWSNKSAVNFEDLTEGLTRTSAVFNQAGVKLEELSGLLTGTNEILQNIKVYILLVCIQVHAYRNMRID